MRKSASTDSTASNRLASIYDDDAGNGDCKTEEPSGAHGVSGSEGSLSSGKLKFAPTIPSTRRKKAEEPLQQTTAASTSRTRAPRTTPSTQPPAARPVRSPNVSVSGPFALGPAASGMSQGSSSLLSSRGRSQSGNGLVSVGRKTPTALPSFDTSSSLALGDTVLAEDAFSEEPLASDLDHFHPVAINQTFSSLSTEIELDHNALLLLQLPPILPKLHEDGSDVSSSPLDEQFADGSASTEPSALSTTFPAQSFDAAQHWPAHAEGQVGKLRRYKSGRVTLSIGPVEFEMKRSAFDEAAGELAAVAIDSESQQLCKLGRIAPGSHFACFLDLSRE